MDEYLLIFPSFRKLGTDFDRWIDTIGYMWTYRSMVICLTRILWSMIDTIDQKEKIDTIDQKEKNL